ncbi:MAG: T9SS type A sorting domain-containing protein [Chitinophagales bacterium]|nr:T9SS type A sorting domain-containing protein [Chitinophagales bacterium]
MKAIALLLSLQLITVTVCNADEWIQRSDVGGTIGRRQAVAFTINDKAYVGTGSPVFSVGKSFWEYDPLSDTWTQKADLAGDGRENAFAFSTNGKGYVGLGRSDDCCYLDDFWEYDPITNNWTSKSAFPGGSRAAGFAFCIDNKCYVGAGVKGSNFKSDFWEYEPTTDTWAQRANYGGGKVGYLPGFSLNGKGYAGTGYDNTVTLRNDFWEYDPSLNSWSHKTNFPGTVRYGCIAFSIGPFGYLGTGINFDSSFNEIWQYNPSGDEWVQKASYPGDGLGFAVAVSNESYAYVGTGGPIGKQWWQYTPDCTPPINLTTLNITSSSAKLKWEVAAGASKYKVQYKIDSMGAPWIAKTVNAANTSIVINNLLAGAQYKWKVRSICSSEKSAYSPVEKFTTQLRFASAQDQTALLSVYPNPIAQSSIISFIAEENSYLKIELFEANGRSIRTLEEVMLEPGRHEIPFDRDGLSAGIYFLKFTNPSVTETIKIIIE